MCRALQWQDRPACELPSPRLPCLPAGSRAHLGHCEGGVAQQAEEAVRIVQRGQHVRGHARLPGDDVARARAAAAAAVLAAAAAAASKQGFCHRGAACKVKKRCLKLQPRKGSGKLLQCRLRQGSCTGGEGGRGEVGGFHELTQAQAMAITCLPPGQPPHQPAPAAGAPHAEQRRTVRAVMQVGQRCKRLGLNNLLLAATRHPGVHIEQSWRPGLDLGGQACQRRAAQHVHLRGGRSRRG